MIRSNALQNFLDAASAAYRAHATDERAKTSLAQIFRTLEKVVPASYGAGARLPVCSHLDDVANPARFTDPSLRHMIEAFNRLEPELEWRRRTGGWTGASANFAESHANALIVGPGGLESRRDVWLGVSLVAPHVLYPDHSHPPEETYLVMGDGEFRNSDTDWISPGPGGTFYNSPNIVHTMRTHARPLFAFWALRAEKTS